MILATDVQYNEHTALAAGVLFEDWQSDESYKCLVKPVCGIAPYEPGAFYKRELPCILSLLEDLSEMPTTIVVDGYVTLGEDKRKGLGMHLYEALDEKVAIIGVAKQAFKDTPKECEVLRGDSSKPLYVTSAGVGFDEAVASIVSMPGKHRIPVLLKKADQLCRGVKG